MRWGLGTQRYPACHPTPEIEFIADPMSLDKWVYIFALLFREKSEGKQVRTLCTLHLPNVYIYMYASFSFALHTYVQPGSVRPSAQESLNHPSPIDPKV